MFNAWLFTFLYYWSEHLYFIKKILIHYLLGADSIIPIISLMVSYTWHLCCISSGSDNKRLSGLWLFSISFLQNEPKLLCASYYWSVHSPCCGPSPEAELLQTKLTTKEHLTQHLPLLRREQTLRRSRFALDSSSKDSTQRTRQIHSFRLK